MQQRIFRPSFEEALERDAIKILARMQFEGGIGAGPRAHRGLASSSAQFVESRFYETDGAAAKDRECQASAPENDTAGIEAHVAACLRSKRNLRSPIHAPRIAADMFGGDASNA
jgi:hypothetical protein